MYHHLLCNKLSIKNNNEFISPYFGREIKENEITEALKTYDSKIIYKKSNDTTKQAAQDVFNNKVIAWYEGKSEVGPRALGHRSLVSNPAYKDNWKRVNKIKEREWWRPFAPSVLEEEANKWFANVGLLVLASVKKTPFSEPRIFSVPAIPTVTKPVAACTIKS